MGKFSRICFTLTACIVLFLLVSKIYNGESIGIIVLYAIWFLSTVGAIIADRIQRRKGKKN